MSETVKPRFWTDEELLLSRDAMARRIAETVVDGGEPDPWDIDGFREVCVEIERRETALMAWAEEHLRQAGRSRYLEEVA